MSEEKGHHENENGAALVEKPAEAIVIEELIDLEEWAKAGKKPKQAKVYRIRIDKEKKDVTVPSMTGREILALVGKTPEKYLLSEKFHGGVVEPVKADQIVRFDLQGVERFQTLALDPTEG